MDSDTKRLLGLILGEVFRVQKAIKVPCNASDAQIFGLLNGFDDVVNDILERTGSINPEQLKSVMDVLEPIWIDDKKKKAFKGFYDIEKDLQERGVDRSDAIRILTYLNANHQFTDLIAKMDSSHSPTECRRFELREWDL